MKKSVRFAQNIIRWYEKFGRNYSWRRTKDPYRILISEMMLQKTDARKVAEIYPLIIRQYPTVILLSRANTNRLRKQINLLGIHDRARRLRKSAKVIVRDHNGKIPDNKIQLLSLLGVGEYIANAVLCFAFRHDVPVLDTNVIRVLQRVFSARSRLMRPRNDKKLWQFAGEIIPSGRSIEYNRGILDFASAVCTVKQPRCEVCPNCVICDYYQLFAVH